MKKFVAHKITDLEAVAIEIITRSSFPTIILVEGDLGAGKTALAKKIGEQLGLSANQIKSPTFSMLNSYKISGNLTFHHLDLYRQKQLDEILLQTLAEIIEDRHALVYIEWPQLLTEWLQQFPLLQKFKLVIEMKSKNERHLTLTEI